MNQTTSPLKTYYRFKHYVLTSVILRGEIFVKEKAQLMRSNPFEAKPSSLIAAVCPSL